MRYLKFENIDDAEQRSRELWEEKLGRPKKQEDETEFMYAWKSLKAIKEDRIS